MVLTLSKRMMFVKRLKRVKFGETKITVISRFVTAATATSSSTQAAVRVCVWITN